LLIINHLSPGSHNESAEWTVHHSPFFLTKSNNKIFIYKLRCKLKFLILPKNMNSNFKYEVLLLFKFLILQIQNKLNFNNKLNSQNML